MCDAMSIKSAIYCDHSTWNFNWYVNYSEDVNVPGENAAAKEALVFMCGLVLRTFEVSISVCDSW